MKVVLLESISKLGSLGSVVNVRDGYAKNFLVPKKKAVIATEENIKIFEAQKTEHEKKNKELEKLAISAKPILESKTFTLIRESSDDGVLYGSVTSKDILKDVQELLIGESINIPLDLNSVQILKKIKAVGIHTVSVYLFGSIVVNVKLNVCRNELEGIKNLETGAN